MPNNAPCRSWVFTLNNYAESDCQRLRDFEKRYLCFGKEVGESGTPHLQGFITFKRSYRLPQLRKLLPRAHWERAVAADAMNYCMKEEYEIEDNRKRKGERTDLKTACQTLKEGGLNKLIGEHPEMYVKYSAGFEKLSNIYCQLGGGLRREKPIVKWLYGPTGVGKTRSVVEAEDDLWISSKSLRWWTGYRGQESILFDDFRKDFCTFHELLRILDRYPYFVEVKGGARLLTATRIYITSCFSPRDVYNTREDIGQLIRRIDNIVHFRAPIF